jgi:excisionase family DNA binding protein
MKSLDVPKEKCRRSQRSVRRIRRLKRATYTVDELANILGVSRATVYAELRAGRIPHIAMGKRYVIPKAANAAWLESPDRQRARSVGGQKFQ